MIVFTYSPLADGGSASSKDSRIIYNVTVKVDTEIAEAWLQWLLKEHAPAIIATNCFVSYTVVKLLEVDELDGPTYAIQYRALSMDDYQKYITDFAMELRQQSIKKWGQQFVDFTTIMEVIH